MLHPRGREQERFKIMPKRSNSVVDTGTGAFCVDYDKAHIVFIMIEA